MATVTHVLTKLDVPVEKVLGGTQEAELHEVLVLGRKEDGELYAASSTGDMGKLLLLFEEFKHRVLAGEYQEP
jgi:hypothetical protein